MSWQAHQAVLYNSKQQKLFKFMSYLAEHANENLMIDPAPNQETLAGFFNTTTRTIRNWINKLVDEKELKQIRVGSGPGNPSAYQITLKIPEYDYPKGGKKAEGNPVNFSTFQAQVAEIKAEILSLKAEISELKVEKAEAKGGKGGKERRKALSTESADDPYIDPSFDPEKNIYIPFEHVSEEILELITAVSQISKQTMWVKNELEFRDAAEILFGFDATPASIAKFGEVWAVKGYYSGKPALKTIVDEFPNWQSGDFPKETIKKSKTKEEKQAEEVKRRNLLDDSSFELVVVDGIVQSIPKQAQVKS